MPKPRPEADVLADIRTFRRDTWDDNSPFSPMQTAVLAALPEAGSLTAAADAVGVHRTNIHHWQQVPAFAVALSRAKELCGDLILSRLHQQALSASESMPSVVARIFLTKGYKPEFRDNVTVRHEGAVLHASMDLDALPPEDRIRLLELAADAQRRKAIAPPADT